MSDLEKRASPSGSQSQVEDVNNNILAQADAPINYDSDGIKGIVRSPYVLGAALLASFGGFSFGYGKARTLLLKCEISEDLADAHKTRVSSLLSWLCHNSTSGFPRLPPAAPGMAFTPGS